MPGKQDKPLWQSGRSSTVWNWVGCLGDSITFGARSSLGYPEYLSRTLREETGMLWPCVNLGVNSETTLQIMRRADRQLREFPDVEIWCLCAGMNDCRELTPLRIWEETYRQLLERFVTLRKKVFVATMPPIVPGRGHLPYRKESREHWVWMNGTIMNLADTRRTPVVRLDGMVEHEITMADSVHPTDAGSQWIADQFAKKILEEAA